MTAPRELAEAVARLERYVDRRGEFLADYAADLRLVLAALAEAQRGLDVAQSQDDMHARDAVNWKLREALRACDELAHEWQDDERQMDRDPNLTPKEAVRRALDDAALVTANISRISRAALAAPPSTAATTLREMLLRAALDGCGAIGYGSDQANMDVATDIVDRILGSTAATPEGKP